MIASRIGRVAFSRTVGKALLRGVPEPRRQVQDKEKPAALQRVSLVERTGIEPVTSGLQSRRSPS